MSASRSSRSSPSPARPARALSLELSPGTSGLTKTSFALIDQLRSIDKRRIRRLFGRVTRDELAAVDQGLELFLGLAEGP
ncbi:MAG: type II toxin-antitoxin system PemK/MazF family toxin [Deltaproteobacteria bacterium]|nr:type II toxin-antitoxin system PemK/MazF family toxin [Deltaproteobacteria bacterium]